MCTLTTTVVVVVVTFCGMTQTHHAESWLFLSFFFYSSHIFDILASVFSVNEWASHILGRRWINFPAKWPNWRKIRRHHFSSSSVPRKLKAARRGQLEAVHLRGIINYPVLYAPNALLRLSLGVSKVAADVVNLAIYRILRSLWYHK